MSNNDAAFLDWQTEDLEGQVFDLIDAGTIIAIAWDLDGTLIENEDLHSDVLERTANAYDITPDDLNELGTLGLADEPVWRMLQSKGHAVPAWEIWRDALASSYEQGVSEVSTIESTLNIMTRAHSLGIPQVVVTNATKRVAAASLKYLGILEMLYDVITVDDVSNPKPHAEPYSLASRILNIPVQKILAIEDSNTGITSATAAGLVAIQIADGGAKSKMFESTFTETIAKSL